MSSRWLAALLLLLATSAWGAGEQLLAKVDAWRLPNESLEIETEVEFARHGAVEKTRQYRVWVAPGRRTLALFQHPSERGQKALMLDDSFWLFLPSAARPVRITPLQKLVGDAAVGDIASLSFSDDYAVDATANEDRVLRFDLSAKRPGVTYAKVVLLADAKTFAPLSAKLFAAGGRLLKEATFENDRSTVSAMRLTDAVEPDRVTQVRYASRRARKFGEEVFNPAYLSRNPELK